ncbi:MAG: hypothetical protein U0Z26_02070 [Anaerolineales bacterium]
MKRSFFSILLIFPLFLAACLVQPPSEVATETPAPTSTPDLCSSENLPGEVAKVNKIMREFDDYSSLASNTPQAQLVTIIPELQRLLRDSEDQVVPPCLQNLVKLQQAHMSVVVQTLMLFMTSTDPNVINPGIAQARDLHNQYDVELARLLGVTLAPTPTLAPVIVPTATP